MRASAALALVALPGLLSAWAASEAGAAGRPCDARPAALTHETDRPVCLHVGTRGEGWGWSTGGFIHWAKCKGVVPRCARVGPGHDVEGWYGNGALIVEARCPHGQHKRRSAGL